MKTNILLVLVALSIFAVSCKKDEPKQTSESITYGTVEMIFTPKVGTDALFMGQEITTPAGELLTINEMKYFVTSVAMVQESAAETEAIAFDSDSCQSGTWLVDFTNPNYDAGFGNQSYSIKFKAPIGEYVDARFAVDVPREYNLADVTSNPYPLNGSNGMYWSWNSGFKFFVINGTSPAVGTSGEGSVHLSIGQGYRAVNYNFRSMLLAAQRNKINVEEGKTTKLFFEYDVNRLLTNVDGTPYSLIQEVGSPNPASVHGGELSTVLQANSSSAIDMADFMITE